MGKTMGESTYWKTYNKEVDRLLKEIKNHKDMIKKKNKEIKQHERLLSDGLKESK